MDVRYLSPIAQQTWRRAAPHMLIKPQLQPGELIPIVAPPPPPPPNPLLTALMPASSLHTKYPALNWSVLLQHVCNEKAAHNS